MGVDNGILDLLDFLVGYYRGEEVRLGRANGAGRKLGMLIVRGTLVGLGRLGIGFALRWCLLLAGCGVKHESEFITLMMLRKVMVIRRKGRMGVLI